MMLVVFLVDWEQRKLGDEFVKVNERNNGQFAKDKWISVAKMYFQSVDKVQSNNIDTRTYVMRMGDIAFEGHPNKDFRFGRFVANDIGDGVVSELFPIYRHIGKYDLEYWKYAIHLERIMGPILSKSITSSGNSSNKINEHHFLKHRINVPNLNEQRKIGHLLKELEIALTLHQRITSYVEWAFHSAFFFIEKVMYDWEQRKLDEISTRVRGNNGDMTLPTLTISAAMGWLNQKERFSGNIAGAEQENYTLLSKGQLSYNHGNSKLAKYGTVFTLENYQKALVPRVYHSFDVSTAANPKFIEYLFATRKPDRELRKLISSGARMDGLLNINYDAFMSITISVPMKEEQERISRIIDGLNDSITLHQRIVPP
ncbi:restriction endonuclease subunit S [Fructobacillus papyrifericola]|uniref:Restriction endonuclease subunit S n=1 Tax=Fructobacillus papyrifericola TaxID=2713172 RepID=A0ABS5QW79_9LACO|nr:restriction endonuclease subunit S [Fructobacillus papyrifericola]MBS9336815.1 restriction endonuclease subunit S [Fructobacillus papyrifericola]